MTRYWAISPFESSNKELFDQVWEFDLENNLISLGWHLLGDLSNLSKEEITQKYLTKYHNNSEGSISAQVNLLWNFYNKIEPGDMVIARNGRKRMTAVGKVTQRAYFCSNKNESLKVISPDNYHVHFLNVDWQESPRNKDFDQIVFGMQSLHEITPARYQALIFGNNPEYEQVDELVEDTTTFVLEKYLEEFIVSNFDSVFKGKFLLYVDPETKIKGQQYTTDVGRIDILAVGKEDNSLVVIELKKGRESDQVVGQTLRYMGWVKENLAKNGEQVRGMIICKEAEDKMTYALKMVNNIELKLYQVDFCLK